MIGALIPLIVAVGISSVVVLGQSSSRQQAVAAARSSLALDALLRARVSVYEEYVPSAAIVAAQANDLTEAQLDTLLGTDFQADLVTARRQVNELAVPGPKASSAAPTGSSSTCGRRVDQKTASPLEVETFFNDWGRRSTPDGNSRSTSSLSNNQSTDSLATRNRITALGSTFNAFTSGLGEET